MQGNGKELTVDQKICVLDILRIDYELSEMQGMIMMEVGEEEERNRMLKERICLIFDNAMVALDFLQEKGVQIVKN